MNPDEKAASVAGAKILTVWGVFSIDSWDKAAAMLAATLSFLFIMEFLWKKIIRPACVYFKWLRPLKNRRQDD